MKTKLLKFWILLVLGTASGFFTPPAAWADHKHRVAVSSLKDASPWSGAVDPGLLVSRMLEKTLAAAPGPFLLVPSPGEGSEKKPPEPEVSEKKGQKKKQPDKDKKKSPGQENEAAAASKKIPGIPLHHPTQYLIEGRVLHFLPAQPLSRAQKLLQAGKDMKEQAEVEVELRLIAHHTEKLIAQKRFRAESAQGEVLFEVGPPPLDLNQPGLQDSSMGRALRDLTGRAVKFVAETLVSWPLEAEIVALDSESREGILNVGSLHGVRFADLVDVYAVRLGFKDPLSGLDLGERYVRRGVLRIREVYDRYARFKIVAGVDMKPGDLGVFRSSHPPVWNPPSSSTETPESPWWTFYDVRASEE